MISDIVKEGSQYTVAFSHANFTGSLSMARSDFERLAKTGIYKKLGFHSQIENKYGQKEDVYIC